ncbi:MAG: hypothetical protein K2W85_04515 [Phycisphaerales bacterium]|nr:hypothetical protein [Phycisphaerales bacterium]
MTMQRPHLARQLVSSAGRLPASLAALAVCLAAPGMAYGQQPAGDPPAAPAMRNPMKPGDKPADKGDGKAKVTVSEHMTVDLHVKDEDLANVLELLSIQTQKNIIASKNVSGKVTATLYGVTFYQALDAILHVNGFGYTENGNFIYVYTTEELKQIQAALKKRVSKTIKLNYINAENAKEFVSPLLSKDGGEIKVNNKTKDFSIPDKAPVGKNDFALGDTMVIFDYEENVAAIEQLVTQIDTRPQQVLVEATILQTSLNEANAFGVDFSVIADLNFVDFLNTGGALSAANSLIRGGSGGSGQGVTPTDDRGYAVSSTVGNTAGQGGFKVGVVSGDVGVFLKVLDQITDTVVLSNPKILALNRQPARVLVGKRVGYLNTTQTETSTTQSVEFLDTGTQLYFRPFVANTGEIRMELKPQISNAEIRTVTDSGGRAVTIPDEVTQELVTNVNVRDGQTIVLGGLFTESSTFTRRQVPIVGDIPILGAAFRGHDDSTVRSEIIFMITPSIVTDALIAGAAERADADIDRVRAGTRQGLLPWSREKMTDKLNVEAERLAREGNHDQALYNIQRSLSLNPNQPSAYRLREKITGERENWNDPSALNSYLDKEVRDRVDSVPPATGPTQHRTPYGSIDIQRKKVSGPQSMSNTQQQPTQDMAAITLPGQSQTNPQATTATQTPTGSEPTGSTQASSAPLNPDLNGQETQWVVGTSEAQNSATTTATASTNTDATQQASNQTTTAPINNSFNVGSSNTGTATINGETYVVSSSSTPTSNEGGFIAAQPNAVANNANSNANFPNPADHSTTLINRAQPTAAGQIKVDTTPAQDAEANTKAQAAKTLTQLQTLRSQIDLYTLMNGGTFPNLGSEESENGWSELVKAQLLKDLPANPLVSGKDSTRVVVGQQPDSKFHANYGWVYDPKTGKLWAVGFDAGDKPLNGTQAPTTTTANAKSPAQPAQPQQGAEQNAQPTAPATANVETEQK